MYYKSRTLVTASHSLVIERQVNVMTDPGPEESPTRYMLPEEEGKGLVDYSLNPHSPTKYPIATKKRKKADKKKTNKPKKEPGKSVQFKPKVTLKTIYTKLKNHLEEVDLTNKDDYPSRVTAFALKRKSQKESLKYQHQYRPLMPRRMSILKHIRDTLQGENGNQSSLSPSQTLDPDEFLESLSKLKQEEPYRNPSPLLTQILYPCPIHPDQALKIRETDTQWGHWEYFKCPVKGCFVSCGSHNVANYLDSAKRQLHEYYYRLPLDKMRCHCANPLAMTMSHSEKPQGGYSSGAAGDCVLSSSGSMKTPEEKTESG